MNLKKLILDSRTVTVVSALVIAFSFWAKPNQTSEILDKYSHALSQPTRPTFHFDPSNLPPPNGKVILKVLEQHDDFQWYRFLVKVNGRMLSVDSYTCIQLNKSVQSISMPPDCFLPLATKHNKFTVEVLFDGQVVFKDDVAALVPTNGAVTVR